MSLLGRLIMFFPGLVIVSTMTSFFYFVTEPTLLKFLIFLSIPYLFPLISFRLHNFFFPTKEGIQKEFSEPKKYCGWWGGYHIQLIYYWLPQLEQLLVILPGAYSFWLRLWGSKIGSRVHWSPNIMILDRNLVDIEDGVIFGYQCVLISHVVYLNKKNQPRLFVKKIKIEHNSFIGAGSNFGPGSHVTAYSKLPAQTILKINQTSES